MNTQEARDLGNKVLACLRAEDVDAAVAALNSHLKQRTPFSKLDLIGAASGAGPYEAVRQFLDQIAAGKSEGGWVVIGSALAVQLASDVPSVLERCRRYVDLADVWYGADILGERVPGRGLVSHFSSTLDQLRVWREDENDWVRRAVGVAVHFWAKRSKGEEELRPHAQDLLSLLKPMFWEWEMAAVKGVGWGLKTLGKHYPRLVADWLLEEIVPAQRRHRALMLRKAMTYLTNAQQARLTEAPPG